MKISSVKKFSFRRAILPASIIAAMAMSGSASAFKVETDNPDLDVRWDNTFRYNAGWRMQDAAGYQKAIAGGVSGSESKWESGDMVTNRLDVLSELDFIYKKDTGFRVSAALWHDTVYASGSAPTKGTGPTLFPGGKWPAEVQRYYGQGAEFLDAFVFTKIELGDVPVNMKLGQHNIYWGETLFSLTNGIAVGQAPLDVRKAVANPGIEAKEVFVPLNQFSFSAQLSPELTIMGQYFLDWKPDRLMMGGTYFSAADMLWENNSVAGFWGGNYTRPKDKTGDWGLATKWRPEWLDGTVGLYYREYTPKNGRALAVNLGVPGFFGGGTPGFYLDTDAPRTKLYGLSLAKQMMGISWGMDLVYRKDAMVFPYVFLPVNPPVSGFNPIANVWSGTLNMIAYDGKRDVFGMPLYDSAVLLAELQGHSIDKFTKNKANWFGNGQTGTGILAGTCAANTGNAARRGCQTEDSAQIAMLFEPKWFQVFPGTDVSMPIFLGYGLFGNGLGYEATEGGGGFSLGLVADVDAKYNFKLAYNGFMLKHNPGPVANAGLGDFSHKGWLSFTAKATW